MALGRFAFVDAGGIGGLRAQRGDCYRYDESCLEYIHVLSPRALLDTSLPLTRQSRGGVPGNVRKG
jgi:hypothetical protein